MYCNNPSRKNICIRKNVSYYIRKDRILKLMFHHETSSYKLAKEIDRIETHKNAKEEDIVNWISRKKQKLVKLSEDEKLNPGKTMMVFDSYSEIKKFLSDAYGHIRIKKYEIIIHNNYILLHNEKISMMLLSLENFNKVIDKFYKENLTVIFDNTYDYYINLLKQTDLINLIYNEENENIEFFFLYGEKQI